MESEIRKGISTQRQDFYLEEDGSCKWTYLGVVDWEEIVGSIIDNIAGSDERVNNIELGQCDVCGKNPLRYNYILKYKGTEKLSQIEKFTSGIVPFAVVGSECIESLSHVDMLKIKRDKRVLKEKKDKSNALAIGTYLRDVFIPHNPELWKISWSYFNYKKNLGGSLKFLSEKCLNGIPLQEKTFGKQLKIALKEAGFPLPDLREMKDIIGWKKGKREEERPVYEVRSEEPMEELPMVPEGMKLKDIYGKSPITGKTEIVHMILIDEKTGKEIVPDNEEVMESWDPIIEIPTAYDWDIQTERYEPVDFIHIHLQKWLAQRRTKKIKIEKKEISPILKALKAIAGDDQDFAKNENGVGFSGLDTEFGHSLASRDFLTEKQIPYAKKLVNKYRRQLQRNHPAIWEEVQGDL